LLKFSSKLRNGEAPLAQLVRQRILIDLLEKPSPERIEYSKGAAEDSFRKLIQTVHICVYSCASV
jgi:hypothetical protein